MPRPRSRRDPVADLGHAVNVVLRTDAARAHEVTRGGVDHGKRPQAAVLPAAAARRDIRTCVGPRVRSRNVVDPVRDLRITAGFRDSWDIGIRPGPEHDGTVGQGRIRRAQPHPREGSRGTSCSNLTGQDATVRASSAAAGAATVAATAVASALPGAQSAWDAPVPLQQANIRVRGAAEDDRLGWSVAGLGRRERRRCGDIAIGAPFAANNERASSGSAYVLYGPFSSSLLDLGALVIPGVRIDGATDGDFASGSLAAGGDVNGDGRADLLIGAPETDFNEREQSGSLYVLFGGSHRGEIDLATFDSFGYRIDGAASTDGLASSAAGIGDVNGDRRADMIIGAPFADNNDRRDSGSGTSCSARPRRQRWISPSPGANLRIDGGESRAGAGWSVAGAGDVNGDGRRTRSVGTPFRRAGTGGPLRRGLRRLRTTTGRQCRPRGARRAAASGISTASAAGDTVFGGAGWSVAGAGDVNGDGRADVLVGVPFFDANRRGDSGSAYVIFGKATPEPIDLAALGTRGFRIDGASAGDLAGVAVAGLGDVNADGRADVLVGAEQADNGGDDSGSVYVVYGRCGLCARGPRRPRRERGEDRRRAGRRSCWLVGRPRRGREPGRDARRARGRARFWRCRTPQSGAAYVLFAPNRRPPRLVVSARSPQRVVSQKGVNVRASCDEPCTLRATGRIAAAGQRADFALRAASSRVAPRGQRCSS